MFGQARRSQSFASYTGAEAAARHQQTAEDAVEDLLAKMVETWEKDELYLAEHMAALLQAPLLDLIAGATERLCSECEHMYRLIDEISPDEDES
ncbi:hypothetical protein HMPREF2978_04630 [Corynebacterium sp. HMSC074C01]|uniref:hypothetical protein n=1 Tax=Corynebacterium sp. HMSC074C01 TaxID=1739482 RepID=UPI0008A64150|nr:hypothetical protein [Corynebacterium sp. HMSC074C01]OFP66470.1 hypothetical protein HMPREF2978_04630 [Corynebacterium sp. HMSC074C01]